MKIISKENEVRRGKPSSNQLSKAKFEEFILENDHPCMMAQTVFKMDMFELYNYQDFGSKEAARQLIKDLKKYISEYDFESNDFKTFLAVFPDSPKYSEIEFEEKLWDQLKFLNKADTVNWDKNVSSDPNDEHFSFSIGGRAFYIVGLHPGASREARRSPETAIAFNLHWQFDKLREMGAYENVRNRIRQRDKELQGTINPMLQDFGKNSEARQYSGRKVDSDWKCPFHKN